MQGYPVYRVPTVALGPTSGEVVNPQVGPVSFPRIAFLKSISDGVEVVVHFRRWMHDNIYLVWVHRNVQCG
jgi:hypothetical protein